MRQEFDISEADLGEISPASETMKLASLGLRGVAATLLWEKAHKYRVMHEWDRLKASLKPNRIATTALRQGLGAPSSQPRLQRLG